MTFVVPFDGSELAEAAVARAVEFATVLDESVVAVTVVPAGNIDYARERGWLGPDAEFDLDAVVDHLRARLADLSSDVEFEYITVDRYAPSGTIARRLRTFADEAGASLVFLGSENAGRLVTALNSVGGSVAAGSGYDVVLVRECRPLTIETIEEVSPFADDRSDFYDDSEGA